MAEGAKPGFLGFAADSETPIEHLDYNYIGKCNNAKEIEKLLRVLRSGQDGYYPELIDFTEKRLEQVNPRSKLLRKDIPLKTYRDLDQSDGEKIKDDIKDWTVQMTKKDVKLKTEIPEANSECYQEGKKPMPPIRSARNISSGASEIEQINKGDESKTKNVVPRNYRDWDRFDPDKELENQEQKEKEAKKKQQTKPKLDDKCIPEGLDHTGISQQEQEFRAAREKDKGNDAFRVGDFDESVVYYTRSISLQPTAAAFNNRAAARIKLKKYQEALDDCNKVLEIEPKNLKAFLRRGIAYKETGQFDKSQQDLQQVLNIESSNKRAKEILDEIKKLQELQNKDTSDNSGANQPKKKGQRMKIVEVDGDEEEMPIEPNNVLNGKDMDTETVYRPPNLDKNTASSSIETNNLHTQSNSTVEPDTEACINGSVAPPASETNLNLTASIPLRTNVKTIAETSSNKNETAEKNPDRVENPDIEITDGSKKGGSATRDTRPSPKPENTQTCETTELPLPGLAEKAKDEGLVLFKKGRFAEALEKYSKAIDILWKDKGSYQMSLSVLLSNRAACHYKIGECNGCIDDCNKALALTPTLTKPRCRRAAALETKEKYVEAYKDYQAVLVADPFNKTAQEGNSRIIKHLQSIHGSNWRQKIPATPSEINPTLEIPAAGSGVEVLNVPKGKAKSSSVSASSDQRKDPAIKPLSDVERFGQLKEKGNAFVKKAKYSEAVDCYTQCITLCPREVASYTNRALCYLKLNKPDLAESDTSEALKLQSDNVKALFRRALARKALKDYDQAAKDLFQLIKIEPKNTAGKKELDIVLELCREKRRMAQKQEANLKEKNNHESETKLEPEGKPRHQEETTNQTKSQPIRRKRIQIEEVEADDEDAEEEKAPVSNAGEGPVSNGPADSVTSPQANTDGTSLKQAMTEGSQNKKPPTPKQPQAPSMKKATAYEFVQAWNSVTKDNVAGYAAILAQVQPAALPKVLSNSLDADMLKSIVKALLQYLLPDGKADQCYKILKNLCHAQRFNMVLLFLAEKDKEDLNSLFSKLEASHSKKAFLDVKELKNLRKKYAL